MYYNLLLLLSLNKIIVIISWSHLFLLQGKKHTPWMTQTEEIRSEKIYCGVSKNQIISFCQTARTSGRTSRLLQVQFWHCSYLYFHFYCHESVLRQKLLTVRRTAQKPQFKGYQTIKVILLAHHWHFPFQSFPHHYL